MASTGVELTVQSERAFQKQPIFLNSKAARKTTRTKRWYKDAGLGFKTPRAAINGQYIGACSEASSCIRLLETHTDHYITVLLLQTKSALGSASSRFVAAS